MNRAILAGLAIGGLVWARRTRVQRFKPRSDELKRLLRDASPEARVPGTWADSEEIHQIIERESGGYIGRPNYTYGKRDDGRFPSDIASPERAHLWPQVHEELRAGIRGARSTATGLGQLILANVYAYYPDGPDGIGNARSEAVGFLRYIRARYGSPANAARYRKEHGHY